jgi:hypothetical protein
MPPSQEQRSGTQRREDPLCGEELAASEELRLDEESGARLKAIPDGRFGDGPDVHRHTLLRHDHGREQHRAGQ